MAERRCGDRPSIPIERNRRMASLDFIKNIPQTTDGDLIDFTTNHDDLWIRKVLQLGPMVFVVNGDYRMLKG